ncbi:MAG: hypothetical protein NTZ44_01990 [Candidatus Nomurabacteria bacterium]|nr:hypothetical protein [Candidatus Nomurabacteria bacterium]
MDQDNKFLNKNTAPTIAVIFLFVIISIWYFYLHTIDLSLTERMRQIWGSAYQVLAIFGGIFGLFVSKKWSGRKSLLGRAILYFSIGLLLQSFGQSVSSYYNFFQNQAIPYPSFGDIGFFGSIFAYIAGAYTLMKATSFASSVKSIKGKSVAIILPLIILVASYFFFLQGYEFDWSNKLKIFLDFGYPFGQAIYVSVAILALFFSRNSLGGFLRKPIIFIIIALVFQYISDFTFLYQANAGTWYVGGMNDFLYAISYFLMALALINLGTVFKKISSDDLSSVNNAEVGVLNLNELFNKIIVEIIYRQERVAGQIAWETAMKVSGLHVLDQKKGTITLNEDPKKVIDSLINNYKSIFGELAVSVSKEAVRHLVAELPNNEIPVSLK